MTEWEAIASRLRHQWAGVPGIVDVRIRRQRDGSAAVFVRSRSAKFPGGLPAAVAVKVGVHSLVLPVLWAPLVTSEKPVAQVKTDPGITDAMWGGAPPVHDQFLPEVAPRRHRPPMPVGMLPPPVDTHEFQVFLPARDPKLPFWSMPLDLSACLCIDHLATSSPVITFEVPTDQMVTLTGISYTVYGAANNDRLRFSVSRSGNEQARWDDQVMDAAAEGAHQFAFAGHLEPLPLNLIVDHDQMLVVSVTALGGAPYTPSPLDPIDVQVCVLLRGWISTLNDRRDGAPKSYDVGGIGEAAFGDLDVVGRFTDRALAAAVQQVVDAEAAAHGVKP
jgi:hypothetical protein